jgi:hypothetical protein
MLPVLGRVEEELVGAKVNQRQALGLEGEAEREEVFLLESSTLLFLAQRRLLLLALEVPAERRRLPQAQTDYLAARVEPARSMIGFPQRAGLAAELQRLQAVQVEPLQPNELCSQGEPGARGHLQQMAAQASLLTREQREEVAAEQCQQRRQTTTAAAALSRLEVFQPQDKLEAAAPAARVAVEPAQLQQTQCPVEEVEEVGLLPAVTVVQGVLVDFMAAEAAEAEDATKMEILGRVETVETELLWW